MCVCVNGCVLNTSMCSLCAGGNETPKPTGSHITDEEIRGAEEKFAESLHAAQMGMFNLLENDVRTIIDGIDGWYFISRIFPVPCRWNKCHSW